MSRRSYLNDAFTHPYNLLPLVAGLVAGVGGHEPFLTALIVGAEAIWLMFANDNKWFRTYVDSRERKKLIDARRERIGLIADDRDRARAAELLSMYEALGEEIRTDEGHADMIMGDEYRKFDLLLEAFINYATSVRRLSDYPRQTRSLQTQLEALKGRVEDASPASKSILQKSADLLERRIKILAGLASRVEQIRAQMEVIDSTFRLMFDQFHLYKTTGNISDQIDDVLREVQALQEVLTLDDSVAPPVEETQPEPPTNVRKIRG